MFSLFTSPLPLLKRRLSKALFFVAVSLVLVRAAGPGPEPSLSCGLASGEYNKIGNICRLKDTGK